MAIGILILVEAWFSDEGGLSLKPTDCDLGLSPTVPTGEVPLCRLWAVGDSDLGLCPVGGALRCCRGEGDLDRR